MQDIATIEELEHFLGIPIKGYDRPTHCNPALRMSVLCDVVDKLAKTGERNAIKIACTVIVKDPRLPFGKLIKSNFARTLKKQAHHLTDAQKNDITFKTIELLNMEFCPREIEDYCKLIRRFGPDISARVAASAQPIHEKSKRLVANLACA